MTRTSTFGRSAHALELPLLQRAQELHPRRERDLSDLVEEEGPAVGELESPFPAADRAREGPALSRTAGLEERLAERRAAHLMNGRSRLGDSSCSAWAMSLARTGLAQDEDGRLGRSGFLIS
jgi:hypothetical protein